MSGQDVPSEFKVGDEATLSVEITGDIIDQFAEFTGDNNPIHMDEEYAKKTTFGKRIAHGAMLTALFSKLAGTRLPGPGSVVLSAQFDYKSPAFIGDTVTAKLRVKRYRKDKPIVFIQCEATNQSSDVLVEGSAVIFFLKPSEPT